MDSIAYDYESHPASLRELGPSRARSQATERSVVLRRLLLNADLAAGLFGGDRKSVV